MMQQLIEQGIAAERAGDWDAALGHYEAAFRLASEEGSAAHMSEILRRTGVVHQERGDLELSLELFESSLALAEANQLEGHIAAGLAVLATNMQFRGELGAAEETYRRAQALANDRGDDALAAVIEQNLGILANIRGQVSVALRSYGSALDRYRRLGQEESAAGVLTNMAMAHVDLEEWRAAEHCFDEARSLAVAASNIVLAGRVELSRAELFLKRQMYERARESCDRALELFGRIRSKPRLSEAYRFHGILYRETGKLEQAELHFALAYGLAEASENLLLQGEAQTEWALANLEKGSYREAIKRLNGAYGMFRKLDAHRELVDIDRKLERLEDVYTPAVQAWGALTVESHDPFRTGRTERVVLYSAALGEALGISGSDLTWLRAGAAVHDVGNAAVPMELLLKPGTLSPGEKELIQSHTVLGDAMVSELQFPNRVREMVRSHHERWDGRGYPDGIGGEEIPLQARIVSVADVYDALTSARSWRPAYSRGDALKVMEAESGKRLDPQLFKLFREMVAVGED